MIKLKKIKGLSPCECNECGNDTFEALGEWVSKTAVRIKVIRCSACSVETSLVDRVLEELS